MVKGKEYIKLLISIENFELTNFNIMTVARSALVKKL